MRDERHAEHIGRDLLRFFRRLGELDAAAFAAAAGVDLRLYHDDLGAQRAGGGLGFLRRSRDDTAWHRDTIFGQDRLALVFMDLHMFLSKNENMSLSFGPAKIKRPGRCPALVEITR